MFGPWSLENYQLAAVIDSVNRLLVAFGGGEMPEPSPRPQVKRRRPMQHAAALAYLEEIRDRHRREASE